MGTSATVRLIEGVRLIQYLLNTGFTASQTQGLLTGLPVASPVYKTHSFSSLGGGYFWEVIVGVRRPALLILTPFQRNIYKVNAREYSPPPPVLCRQNKHYQLLT